MSEQQPIQQTTFSEFMSSKDIFKTSFKISLLIFYIVIIIYLSFMVRFLQQYYNVRGTAMQPSVQDIDTNIKNKISSSKEYKNLLNIQQKCPENLFSINSTNFQQYLIDNQNLIQKKNKRLTVQEAKTKEDNNLAEATTDEQKKNIEQQIVSLNSQLDSLNKEISQLEKNIAESTIHACIEQMPTLSKLNILDSIKDTNVGCVSEGSLSENKRCQHYSLNSYKHIMIVIWVVQIVVFMYTLYWLYSHRSALLPFHKIQQGIMVLNFIITIVIIGLSAGAFANYKKYPSNTITIGNTTYNCKEFIGGVPLKDFIMITISLLSFIAIQLVIMMFI
jgi:uncharacterized membrane protein (DUF485 family)